MDRREFLALSAAAGAAARAAPRLPLQAPPSWYATMRRCGQLNLNERDPLTLDVAGWIDYWSSLKLDALLLNGGGLVAFYLPDVRYHPRSELLGSRALFREPVAAPESRSMPLVALPGCNHA